MSSSSGTRFVWTAFETWMNDRDPDFAAKAVAIIEPLLNPPTDGPLFCVDEKPGMGVREPTLPDQPPVPVGHLLDLGRHAASSSTYATAWWTHWPASASMMARFWLVRFQHRSREFCEPLQLPDEQILAGQPIHLILDPISSHWPAEVLRCLDAHPRGAFVFHFLPVHASWLSFVEAWFSILSRKCVKRTDFANAPIATQQIQGFLTTCNTYLAHPSNGGRVCASIAG